MIPFYSYGFGLLLYWLIFERYFRPSSGGFPWYQSIYGLIYAGSGNNFWLRSGGAIWFLPCYFMAIVCYEVIARIAAGRKHVSLFLIIVMSMVGFYYCTWNNHINLPFGFNQALLGLPWIWLGSQFSKEGYGYLINDMSFFWRILFCALFLYISFQSDLRIDLFSCSIGTSWVKLYAYSMGGIILAILLGVLLQGKKLVQMIGSNTLSIMCLHQVIGRILFKLFSLATGLKVDAIGSSGYSVILCMGIVGGCLLLKSTYSSVMKVTKLSLQLKI